MYLSACISSITEMGKAYFYLQMDNITKECGKKESLKAMDSSKPKIIFILANFAMASKKARGC